MCTVYEKKKVRSGAYLIPAENGRIRLDKKTQALFKLLFIYTASFLKYANQLIINSDYFPQ